MVSVILATYNEAENIVPLIAAVRAAVPGPVEVIVVDDDSPDGTWRLAEEVAKTTPDVRVVRRVGERGLTSAIREGIRVATGDTLVWMDCDFSHPPAEIPRLLAELDGGADVAVASRYVPGGADRRDEALHRVLSRTINGLAQRLLDPRFHDYTSGFIAVRRRVLAVTRLEGDYGEYFMSLVFQAMKKGFVVRETPLVNYSRQAGRSKTATNPLGFAVRGRKYLYKVFALAAGVRDA